ncbi:MAG: menaquinone biosynthetic enzyme MqnA/MqnD family protein [Phycisphaerales bacterium JB050]
MTNTTIAPETDAAVAARAPAKVGAVSYLNTLPLIEGLGKLGDAELTLTAPSGLIDLLLGGEVDLALASIIDYQRSPEPLELVPASIIGCDGATMTVRIFSRIPIEQIRTLHADVDSHTSVALARIILNERTGAMPSVRPFDVDEHRSERGESVAAGAWPESVLIIGDKVITDSPPAALYPHQLDLGEAWKELTGLPFVYATWMRRVGAAEDGRLRTIARVLDRQRRHNATRLDWIVGQRATLRGWPRDTARTYLGDLLRYEMTDRHREAVEEFFDRCAALKIIDRREPTRWAEI